MRKITAIGESVLDITFGADGQPLKSFVGGRVANIAAELGRKGLPVTMVSECCTDCIGDAIIDFHKQSGVNINSIDRYTDGATPISLIYGDHPGDAKRTINYAAYPEDRFDVVWPRIDEDDILLFGSYYSIDHSLRKRLFEMVKYAGERKASIIYLPGCQHGINCRITKVMPEILENFEIADIVIAKRQDLEQIYPGEDPNEAYRDHIEYYDCIMLYIDDDYNATIYTRGNATVVPATTIYEGGPLRWQSRFAASLIGSLLSNEITTSALRSVSPSEWEEMVRLAISFAVRPE